MSATHAMFAGRRAGCRRAQRGTAVGPVRPFTDGRFVHRSECRGRGHPSAAHAVAVCASLRLHCGARSEVARPNSLRSLRSLRSDNRRESVVEARWRAPTSALCSSPPQKSPPPGTPCRSGSVGAFRSNAPDLAAKACPDRLRSASEAPSSAGRVARARSALRELTCRRLSERSERSERSEFGDGPRDRAAQGSRRAATTAEAKRSSLPGHAFARADRSMQSGRSRSALGRKQSPVAPCDAKHRELHLALWNH
jgi:hypothetical protein